MPPNEPDRSTDRPVDSPAVSDRPSSRTDCPRRPPVDAETASRDEGLRDSTAQRRCPHGGCPIDDPFGRLASDERAAMERRDVAKILATVGGLAAVGSLAAPLAGLTQVFEEDPGGQLYAEGVALVDESGDRIQVDRLDFGEHLTVFPETNPGLKEGVAALVRYEEEAYGERTELAFTVEGYAAYSIVCTHAGCVVGNWQDGILVCPCHAGKYDPLRGATVVGGPPPRNLPQLPITVSADGYLVAAGPFPAPIGPIGGG